MKLKNPFALVHKLRQYKAICKRQTDPSFELAGMFSLLVLISSKLYLNLTDCVQHAYNQIKDRKGKMINGVWVKQEDLQNE